MNRAKKIIVGTGVAGSLALGSQIPIQPTVSVQEWQEITRMYNTEIEKAGGKITISNFTGDIKQLNDIIRIRPAESIEYQNRREELLKKTESRTVLDAIVK